MPLAGGRVQTQKSGLGMYSALRGEMAQGAASRFSSIRRERAVSEDVGLNSVAHRSGIVFTFALAFSRLDRLTTNGPGFPTRSEVRPSDPWRLHAARVVRWR